MNDNCKLQNENETNEPTNSQDREELWLLAFSVIISMAMMFFVVFVIIPS